jgi:hypothetical protein
MCSVVMYGRDNEGLLARFLAGERLQ